MSLPFLLCAQKTVLSPSTRFFLTLSVIYLTAFVSLARTVVKRAVFSNSLGQLLHRGVVEAKQKQCSPTFLHKHVHKVLNNYIISGMYHCKTTFCQELVLRMVYQMGCKNNKTQLLLCNGNNENKQLGVLQNINQPPTSGST